MNNEASNERRQTKIFNVPNIPKEDRTLKVVAGASVNGYTELSLVQVNKKTGAEHIEATRKVKSSRISR